MEQWALFRRWRTSCAGVLPYLEAKHEPMKIVMSASHGGFGSERVPLGGGAAIFERLASHKAFRSLDLTLLGAGNSPPPDLPYEAILSLDKAPSSLGVLEYAQFSREFGRRTTERTLELKPDLLLCHDISEGPDVKRLEEAGIKTATIFHVDVVDIFNRLYLGSLLHPATLTQLYRSSRALPWPAVLQLVFEKQQNVMDYGCLSVVPSSGAASLLKRCYPDSPAPIRTIGWGAPAPRFSETELSRRAAVLRQEHGIEPETRILLTLSRLSPEKAQNRLLEAALLAEENATMPPDVTIVIAGAPAFMDGQKHAAKLRKLASRLTTPVVFPGHAGGLDKEAWYHAATLFVVNSLHESYGLTTLEAMQHGCPVVAVESFGTADTVTPEVGRLVPPGPELPLRLWSTLDYLLRREQTETLNQMSRAAKEKSARETFDHAAATLLAELHCAVETISATLHTG